MMSKKGQHLIAIGRSRLLYDSIRYLVTKGYIFHAIITEEAYEEYDVKREDFEKLANELQVQLFAVKDVNKEEIVSIVKKNDVCAAISVNWKYTIPKKFLDLFKLGILNFHLGNLPDYKGNATVNWSIINGENHINANIHRMDPILDAGDIIALIPIPIGEHTYVNEILKKAEKIAPQLYAEALDKLNKDPFACEIEGTTKGLRCYPRLPEDSQIDWSQSVDSIYKLIRSSGHPYKGAFSFLNGEKIIFWKAKPYVPESEFLAIPGHVVGINTESKSILIACTDGMIELLEAGYKGKELYPAQFIKSIRVRFKYKADAEG